MVIAKDGARRRVLGFGYEILKLFLIAGEEIIGVNGGDRGIRCLHSMNFIMQSGERQ